MVGSATYARGLRKQTPQIYSARLAPPQASPSTALSEPRSARQTKIEDSEAIRVGKAAEPTIFNSVDPSDQDGVPGRPDHNIFVHIPFASKALEAAQSIIGRLARPAPLTGAGGDP